MKLRFHILLIFLSLGQIVFSQKTQKGVLQGKVLYKDGDAVDMATVFIKSESLYAITNEKGFFKIENLLIGKHYEVEVKIFGNESVKSKVYFDKKYQEIVIKLNNNEGISLSEVTVSGSGNSGRKNKDQGYAMNVINTKDALIQNIQTTELLGRSAGVKIRQSAGLGSDISFNLNGLSGNSVRIFIDGIPIRNYGRSFSLSSIPSSMIERIEVYKGVLPSELSEDALGGGINVVLKKEMKNNLITSYSYGSFNTHQWNLNGSYRSKETGFVVNLSSFYNHTDNNYKVWGETVYVSDNNTGEYTYLKAKRFHDKYYSSGIKSDFGFVGKKWADEFLVGIMFSETKKDIQTGATMQVVYGNRRTEYDSHMANLRYKKNNLFLKGLDISTFTTYSKTNRQVIDTLPYIYTWKGKIATKNDGTRLTWKQGAEAGDPTLAMNDERNLANRSNIHYHIGKHQTIGVSYLLNTFTRKIDDPLLATDIRAHLDTRRYFKQILGLNYDLNVWDNKLKASLFYKIYHQNVQLTEFIRSRNPNGSITGQDVKHDKSVKDNGYGLTLSYVITPKIMLLTSAERAIRLPESSELLGNYSEGINPSLGLKPEYGYNFNLGLNITNVLFGKHEIGTEVNLFVRDMRDMIIRGIPRPNDDFFRFENLGKVINKGIDAELRYSWSKQLFINANASYINALFNLEYAPDTGLRYAHYKSRLRNTPYLTANVNVEYTFRNLIHEKERWTFNYNFGYTHEFFKEWEVYGAVGKAVIPVQPLHDVGLTYTFPNQKWTLAFDAKNIFDTQVFDNYALQKPGRGFYGKVTFSLL